MAGYLYEFNVKILKKSTELHIIWIICYVKIVWTWEFVSLGKQGLLNPFPIHHQVGHVLSLRRFLFDSIFVWPPDYILGSTWDIFIYSILIKNVRNHDNNMHLLLKIWPSERQAYFTGPFTRTAKILSFYNTCELSMQKIKRYFYYSITFSYCLDFFKIWTFSYLLRIPFLLSRQDIFPGDWLGGVICCSCIGRGWNCNEDGISELRMAYGNYKSRKNWCRLKWCEYFPQEPYFEKELLKFCSTKNSKSILALLIW